MGRRRAKVVEFGESGNVPAQEPVEAGCLNIEVEDCGLLARAVDMAADTRAGVSARHRREWLEFRERFLNPLYAGGDAEEAKLAKAVADILKVYQEGERKAWGFADGADADNSLNVGWELPE